MWHAGQGTADQTAEGVMFAQSSLAACSCECTESLASMLASRLGLFMVDSRHGQTVCDSTHKLQKRSDLCDQPGVQPCMACAAVTYMVT